MELARGRFGCVGEEREERERERRSICIVSGLYIPSINYFYGVTERREIMGIQ